MALPHEREQSEKELSSLEMNTLDGDLLGSQPDGQNRTAQPEADGGRENTEETKTAILDKTVHLTNAHHFSR